MYKFYSGSKVVLRGHQYELCGWGHTIDWEAISCPAWRYYNVRDGTAVAEKHASRLDKCFHHLGHITSGKM
jgi:hypothetical protein